MLAKNWPKYISFYGYKIIYPFVNLIGIFENNKIHNHMLW